jgi:hypothetical protein
MARRAKLTTRRGKGRGRSRVRRPAPRAVARRRAPRAPARYIRKPKRNPRGFLGQPVVRYGGLFLGGVALGAYVNRNDSLEMVREKLPESLSGWQDSTIGAVTLGLISWFFLKGKNRMYGLSFAFGMAAPAVVNKTDEYLTDSEDSTTKKFLYQGKPAAITGRRYIPPTRARSAAPVHRASKPNVLQ